MTDQNGTATERPGFIAVLFSTFITVFVAEFGDKTQLATLLLSAQSGSPGLVFLGAAFALISSSLVGVLIGRWLEKAFPPERLELMAGLLMVCLGLWLGLQASRSLLAIRTHT
ncbi:TMEM165/GDT1 family protein [Synechococcus sp. M16CYN]|uniref:TMEM165/GDT1 family protein n=1 Tax=Synechococcus sp. M16CYN TaxID=3103139 RepID=UPI0032531DB0